RLGSEGCGDKGPVSEDERGVRATLPRVDRSRVGELQRGVRRRRESSPMTPRRKVGAQVTKITPWTAVAQGPEWGGGVWGAGRRPERGAEAAEGGHQDALPRHGPVHVGGGGEWEDDGLGPARQSGEGRGEHEGHQLVALRGIAEGHRARLVLANGLEHLAEG